MLTRPDLMSLAEAEPRPGVSIFLPTHLRGREIRQDPVRLKNLLAEAGGGLARAGLQPAAAEALLAPATALVEDYAFWQHQDRGLALFLGDGPMRLHRLPIGPAEEVVVGPAFRLAPLLPLLEGGGTFHVLTITADRVRLFDASRFGTVEDEGVELPRSLDEVTGEPDYENPLQASPVGRPHTAAISVTKAQVYGDSPEEWRKARLLEFLRRVGAALEAHLAARPAPVVLVADAGLLGHFRKQDALGPLLAGVVEANPEALDARGLHAAAHGAMRPHLQAGRRRALGRLAALRGMGDPRAVERPLDILAAAHDGRVETLLLAEGATLPGYPGVEGVGPAGGEERDLLDLAAARTLRHGGDVLVLPREELPVDTAAAILRY